MLIFSGYFITLHYNPHNSALENGVKSMVYRSPKITLKPGSVSNKFYYDIDMPKGHIALKSFDAEIVDEAGVSVPLHETYVHHWITIRYFDRKGVTNIKSSVNHGLQTSDYMVAGNAGVCGAKLPQFFGFGSETRKTYGYIPDPYAIVVGNPLEVPDGYEEKWTLNIHAIDTRGAVDRLGCTECRCDVYNVTINEYGRPIAPDYVGGIFCCFDGTHCPVKNGFEIVERNVYLKYTVKWVDWSDSIVPVTVFVLDITDTWQNTGIHDCLIEYDVEKSCTGVVTNDYISSKRSNVSIPGAGDVIYGTGHLHSGGTASALYGEDGRVICSSKPIYG
ncbi:uncharacterized protein [Rutidosis leptorrhynchoides]|uniref:uncharacterized protein n=1 Tax=Rutidosis leptorrhynchoides TaxID=125765 RepID=UPI003A991C22